ncbi:MAG: M23 family metallopeptidase [Actinomycetota bacterium]|nr:M23 family metallopeptidase [Actinomycetota bacterium]
MPSRRPPARTARIRERRSRRARRARRIVGLVLLIAAALVTIFLTAFGTGTQRAKPSVQLAPAGRLVPAGPPSPQVIAMQGSLPLQLPVPQARVTAIGYHAPGSGALALHPLGRKANEGFFARVFHRIFGGDDGGLRYYQLSGGHGPETASLDVGAPAGTDVYSPVDGTVVGLTDFVLNGRGYGARIAIQPATAPSVVVVVTRVRPDPALTVGSSISAATSKLGVLLDLSRVERQALARYTRDAGNHVSIEVHRATTLAIP